MLEGEEGVAHTLSSPIAEIKAVVLLEVVRRSQVRRYDDDTPILGCCLLFFFRSLMVLLLHTSGKQIIHI